jgi:hypothetical protein
VVNLEDWKTKLSVLWLIHVVGGVSFVVLALFESGDLSQIMGLKLDSSFLLLLTVMFLVPSLMAFLSQTLNDKANRWTNIIVGAVFSIFPILGLIAMLVTPSVIAINGPFGILWSALIVWYAWKSKQKA